MNINYNERFEDKLEDLSTLQELRYITDSEWVFDLRKAISASILKYDRYSTAAKFEEEIFDNETQPCKVVFPAKDISLARFLNNSLTKQDVLKPYGIDNEKSLANASMYKVNNAVVICTPTSIAIIDSDNRLIKQISHNAAEAVHIWWMKHESNVEAKELNKACFISTQQTFNLGHWYIDTLSKYIYFKNKMEDFMEGDEIRKIIVITDAEHKLVSSSLQMLNVESIRYSLPYSIYKVSELYVPYLSSFDKRVLIAREFVSKNYIQQSNSTSSKTKRLYLSRQKQKRRKIINHSVLESILIDNDIKTIYPENHSISEVMTLISNAEVIIGPNGAAICNILGSNEDCNIGIIYPRSHLDDYYFRVANSLGNRNLSCICSEDIDNELSTRDMIQKYYYPDVGGDYFVEYEKFKKLVKSLCH